MEGCRITDEWRYRDIRTVIMENEFLKVTILVDLGAKIHEFVYKPSDRDFLYHHPRVEPRIPTYGVNVDNWWTGGIDDVIPSGHPSVYRGEEYPFLGETWSLSWYYDIVARDVDEVSVHLWRPTIIAPLILEKWITLRSGEKALDVHYKLTNTDSHDFDFIWGIHPAFDVNSNSRIDIPAEDVQVEDSLDDRLGARGATYKWPYVEDKDGKKVDMRQFPSDGARAMEFHFATKIDDGWLAVTDTQKQEGMGVVFPKDIFSVIWLWLGSGGSWRGLANFAAVEAWCGYPAKLNEAVERGRFLTIGPGEELECDTKFVAFTGVSSVSGIKVTGEVEGG